MRAVTLIAPVLTLAAATPAAAGPCLDQIQALDLRLASPGAMAAEAGASRPAMPQDALPQGTAGSAASAADRFEAARAALARARTLDARGDERGCDDALSEAKRALGPLP